MVFIGFFSDFYMVLWGLSFFWLCVFPTKKDEEPKKDIVFLVRKLRGA